MAKTLIIVESPAKAKSISKFLGKHYVVKASMGHVRDLPKSEFGVDVENGFRPRYITIRGKGETIRELRDASRKVERVLLALDPDREGEAIAWHLQHLLDLDGEYPCRIEFNEVTKPAVRQAVANPRPIDLNRVNAQQARRILDRLVGYNLSPLLWRKVKKGLSAGRVQSVAVRLICEREEEIRNFVPEEYWTLAAHFLKEGAPFAARLVRRNGDKIEIRTGAEMEAVLRELEGAVYVVREVSKRERLRQPAPPFTTSTLQQEGLRKLNFSTRKTMLVAQQLYEGLDLGPEGRVGLITYIRTDSTRVSAAALEEARAYIGERFGPAYVPPQPRQWQGRGRIQDAHEAIRPTSVWREPGAVKKYLTEDQYRLYELIWRRFVASQMSPVVLDVTRVDIGGGRYLFRATGSVVRFPGFMEVYTEGRDDGEFCQPTDAGNRRAFGRQISPSDEGAAEEGEQEMLLPPLAEGEVLSLERLEPKQHFTQPPPRYTEATLVKVLEERGVGRPSTYAPTIETILKRGYVVRRGKYLHPSELAFVVVDLLKRYFPDVINVEFTAAMEEKLDRIEEGEADWVEVLREFYGPFRQVLARAEQEILPQEVAPEKSEETCPACGQQLIVKTGRYGPFLACPGYPGCQYTRGSPQAETGARCPKCGRALVMRRTRRGRKFYGCSGYPACDFVTWDRPVAEPCPRCGGLMVEKGPRRVCSDRECGYQEGPGRETGEGRG